MPPRSAGAGETKGTGESVAQLLIDCRRTSWRADRVGRRLQRLRRERRIRRCPRDIRGDQAPPEQVTDWSALGLDSNFVSAAPAGDYWYSFDGNAQTLDHVLLSSGRGSVLSGFAHAHIDARLPEPLRGDPARPERLSITIPLSQVPVPPGHDSSGIRRRLERHGDRPRRLTEPRSSIRCPRPPTMSMHQCRSCAHPASGTFFAVGATTVSCTASGYAGEYRSRSFLVTVTPAIPPVHVGVGQSNGPVSDVHVLRSSGGDGTDADG